MKFLVVASPPSIYRIVSVQQRDEFIPTLGYEGLQWVPVNLICRSVRPSLCLSVSLSGQPCHFLEIICVACNFAQCIQPQATGSNIPSGSIICPYVHLSIRLVAHGPCAIFLSVLISSVGVQRRDEFIPTPVSKVPHWGPVEIICLSVRISVSLFLFLFACIYFW